MAAILSVFFILILVVLGHSTFMRNFAWKTEESLWISAIDRSPNLARPYHNLGKYYGSLGLTEKEIACYLQALRIGRDSHGDTRDVTHYNLGLALKRLGKNDEALDQFRKAVRINPRFSDAHNNLAAMLIRERRYDEAFDSLIRALTHNDRHWTAHHNLGIVLLKQRRLEEAASEFRKALAIKKDFSPALRNLGIVYKYDEEFPRARNYFQMALKGDRKDIMTRLHLLETLHHMGDKIPLRNFLVETVDLIPAKELADLVDKISADAFPDQEAPNLSMILPLLGEAYVERSERVRQYVSDFLGASSRN